MKQMAQIAKPAQKAEGNFARRESAAPRPDFRGMLGQSKICANAGQLSAFLL
jgi:hypothetical protein